MRAIFTLANDGTAIRDNRGIMKSYETSEKGTSFSVDTPQAVRDILDRNIPRQNRLRLFYGKDGKSWNEEYGVIGYIGRSGGSIKIPLLIANSRSSGGGGVLDDCIIRIQDVQTKRVLYQADGFTLPEFTFIAASTDLQAKGYTTSVFDHGGNVANFRSEAAAIRWIAFMRGERMTK